ncbi:uncharacterized protein LOC111481959 isoform X3 [Cucurbita maxima]|uniref:Uncharacterized protein LOC111481959 isoform X3 n=1 Tax=Cucurbita maxima TaxID=3661 RepID=A0A6J1J750_CUCMA|nr:uncharacterized protein LOC111481959 isoform X3 [Cucurbita maxima]
MRSLLQSELLHSVISSLFDFRRVDMCMASISLPNPHFCYGRAQPKYQFREERRFLNRYACSKRRTIFLKKKRMDMLDYLYTSQYQMRGIVAEVVPVIKTKKGIPMMEAKRVKNKSRRE